MQNTIENDDKKTDGGLSALFEFFAAEVASKVKEGLVVQARDEPYTMDESDAADYLGIPKYVLKGCRERGEIHPKKVGKKWRYTRQMLHDFAEPANV